MSRDVVHIRSTGRTASQVASSSDHTGFAIAAGPVDAQLAAIVDPDGPAPGTLTVTSDTLFNTAFINVSWIKTDPTVVSFEVHLDRSGGGGLVQTQRTEGITAYFEPIVSGQTYDVTVYNIYLNGQRGNNSAVGSVVGALDSTVPGQPSGVNIGAGLRTVTAAWTDNTEVDVVFGNGSYQVQLATDSGFTTVVYDKKISGTITSIADLTPNTTYWFRVAAIDTSGNVSPWSTGISTTTVQATGNDVLDAAIDTQHIANAAIGTLQVADAAITDAKVIDLNVAKLRAGTISGREVVIGGTAAVAATANWDMPTGTNGSVTSMTVNGTELLGSAVPFNTSVSQTEQDVSTEINLGTGTHGFTSIWSGGFVVITSPQPSQDWNGYVIVTTSTGDLTVTNGTFANGENLGILRSGNYVAGSSGWYIDGTGSAELNNVTVRGTVYASSGSFSGAVYASSGSFTGAVYASSGTFTGTINAGSVISADISGDRITGGTIQGVTYRTGPASGARIELTNTHEMNFYSSTFPTLIGQQIKYNGVSNTLQLGSSAWGGTAKVQADIVELWSATGNVLINSGTKVINLVGHIIGDEYIRASSGNADGGPVIGQVFSTAHVGLRTNGMASTGSEYVIMSDGTDTHVSGGTGGSTYIRGGANSTTGQIQVNGSNVIVTKPLFTYSSIPVRAGNYKALYINVDTGEIQRAV